MAKIIKGNKKRLIEIGWGEEGGLNISFGILFERYPPREMADGLDAGHCGCLDAMAPCRGLARLPQKR